MKKKNKFRPVLFLTALAILLGSTGLSVWLLFSNYQNIQLLRQAEKNFRSGDSAALLAAEKQLLQLIKNDDDNEQAFILLGKIAAQKKICPEEIYYCYQAHKLNPLSKENEKRYIQSLLHAREFERLENVLSIKTDLSQEYKNILLYAAGQNGHTSKYVQVSADKNGTISVTGRLLVVGCSGKSSRSTGTFGYSKLSISLYIVFRFRLSNFSASSLPCSLK